MTEKYQWNWFGQSASDNCEGCNHLIRTRICGSSSKPFIYVTSRVEDSFGGREALIAVLLLVLACRGSED